MRLFARSSEVRFTSISRRQQMVAATVSILLLTALSGLGQSAAKSPIKAATEGKVEIKEELTLKNGDRLTGQLLNSTGAEIKFKSDLAGEVTVAWENVKELKTKREFAIVPKDVKTQETAHRCRRER
jgi:hypothetical protein